MNHEKNCACSGCDCDHDMEKIKKEFKETTQDIKEKTEELKDKAVDFAKEHELKDKAKTVVEKTTDLAKDTKEKYDKADAKTQANIQKGIIGGLATIAAIIGLKKIFGKKK